MNRYREISKAYEEFRIACKCSCVTYLSKTKDREICRWCGKYVYLDKKTEFKYRTQALMNESRCVKEY